MESGGITVLQLSMRRIHDLVAFCAQYEFEDVVAETTRAERIEPANFPALELSRRIYRLGRMVTRSPSLARRLTPSLAPQRLTGEFDLFFPVFNHPHELFTLAAVPEWRARCRVAACFIAEMWANLVPEYLIELLADFDHVFLGVSGPVAEASRILGRPCSYLPLAVDVPRFAPFPDPPDRAIEVCNIGRRSPVTHAGLLQVARERRFFYYYDTVRASGSQRKQVTFSVSDPAEHRRLLATLLQRSRYYVANRARVNEPESTQGAEEISARFYEGAAAGAVLIGEPPRSAEFRAQFDWEDAVIFMPFDSPEVAEFLRALDAEPERLARIRRLNVHHAALRHDWGHRLRTVFEALGLPPTQAMLAREERLRSLAAAALQAA